MNGIEALRNNAHREARRTADRRTRRTPCIVDSYDGNTHRVKVKLQPEGTLTGWLQIETLQIGLMVAPNIGDPGWVEFHESDRRAGTFVASTHNDQKPPPKVISAGEFYYQQPGTKSSVYFKNDGSVMLTDKNGTELSFDGQGNASVTASIAVNVKAPSITLGDGGEALPVMLADNTPSTVLKAQ